MTKLSDAKEAKEEAREAKAEAKEAKAELKAEEEAKVNPQKPSLGRIVLFRVWDGRNDQAPLEHPALITRVWSDVCVNLTVFPDNDQPFLRSSVIYNSAEVSHQEYAWRWPPKV